MSGNKERPHECLDIVIQNVFHRYEIKVRYPFIPLRGNSFSIDGLQMDHSLWTLYILLNYLFRDERIESLRRPQFDKETRILVEEIKGFKHNW